MTFADRPLLVAVVSFLLASGITMALVPQVRRLGLSIGLFDEPDGRKQHSIPMVRLGGIAMVVGFALSLSIVWGMGGFGALTPARDQLIWSTLAGSLCFFLIGLADDLFALSPWPRLAGQIAVSTVIWTQGVQIGAIDLPWFTSATGAIALPDSLSLLATVVWLVGVTNAINWLDGLDGLAAGVAGIAAIGLVSVSFSLHQVAAGFLAAALAGCCLGFLRHNFNPARIFMGDGGSYFLGFTLSSGASAAGNSSTAPSAAGECRPPGLSSPPTDGVPIGWDSATIRSRRRRRGSMPKTLSPSNRRTEIC